MSIRVSVTYDVVTEASVVDGDTADNGFIDPRTEARRSFSVGRKRDIDRAHRLARAGRFDWSLRDAIAFIVGRSCASHETCFHGEGDRFYIRATDEYQGIDQGKERVGGSPVLSVSYDLHVEGASVGTCMRLARLAAYHGVYLANMPLVMRAQREDAKRGLFPDLSGRRQAFGERVAG